MKNTLEKNQIKFVNIQYPGISILINECQLIAGVEIGHEKSISSSKNIIRSSMEYCGKQIAVLDFNIFLNKYFNISSNSDFCTALIVDIDLLQKSTSSKVMENLKEIEQIHQPCRIVALKINSMMESIKISIDKINLLPELVRNNCIAHGLVGVSFTEKNKIGNIIDLNAVIPECIAKSESGGNEN